MDIRHFLAPACSNRHKRVFEFEILRAEVFYLFLKKYIPDRCFEMLEKDKDSMYFSLSGESMEDCVPEKLKPSYFWDKLIWMPAKVCPKHEEQYIE